ncbi:MAG: hypothetical protein ACRBFS_12110 [Aureispira sp.]
MAIDLDQVKDHYSKMHDAKLESIAKFEMASLQPGVQPIVIAEIKKRGLDKNLLKGIEAQKKEFTTEDVSELRDKIKGLTCPSCGKSDQELVGGIIRKVRSYLIITQQEARPMIACRDCVEAKRKDELIKNSLFGWWGFPWGLYQTPLAIINHFRDAGKQEEISEAILVEFVIKNVGELKTNWEKEYKLTDFIHHQNTVKY